MSNSTIDSSASTTSGRQGFTQLRKLVWRDKKALIGTVVLTIFLIAAILGSLIAPYDPNGMDFDMMEPPSWSHPLGTDDLGRDLLSRVIVGAQVSLFVGVSTVIIALVAGLILGILAGYLGAGLTTSSCATSTCSGRSLTLSSPFILSQFSEPDSPTSLWQFPSPL